MCIKLNIFNLIVNIIDREKILINAHNAIFSNFKYIFYILYINRNVIINYK